MISFFSGDHVRRPDGSEYIFLFPGRTYLESYVLAANKKKALPELVSINFLDNSTLISQQGMPSRPTAISASTLAKMDRRWSAIKPLVDDPRILASQTRWRLILSHAPSTGFSPSRILDFLRYYWRHGQTQEALIYETVNRKPPPTKGRGRKPKRHSRFDCTEEDEKIIRAAIINYYLAHERTTKKKAYIDMCNESYARADEESRSVLYPPGERPSQRQFDRRIRIHFSAEEEHRRKKGDKDFDSNVRASFDSSRSKAVGAGHIYEMDATLVDVMLVSEVDRALIVGRPTLFYLVCVFTRLIVGWYLGYEHASWQTALHAIFSISDDKESQCRRLNVTYDTEHWPAHGILAKEVHADRGEAMHREAVQLASGLKTTVTNVPGLRPDMKGLVEGLFKTTHQVMADTVPGYSPGMTQKLRRKPDGSKEASMTLRDLEEVVLKSIIAHNNRPNPEHRPNGIEFRANVLPTPINLWNLDIAKQTGRLSRVSAEVLRTKLLPEERVTVTRHGFNLGGLYYKSADPALNRICTQGKNSPIPLPCLVHRNQVDTIHIWFGGKLVPAFLTSKSPLFKELSFMEAQLVCAEVGDRAHDSVEEAQNIDARLRRETQEAAREAKAKTQRAAQGMSVRSRRKDIIQTREQELERERIARSSNYSSQPTTPSWETDTSAAEQTFPNPLAAAARAMLALISTGKKP